MNVLTKKRYDVLREAFGDLDTALEAVDETLLRKLGCKEESAFGALNRRDEFDSDAYQAVLEKKGIRLITLEDEDYPTALHHIGDQPVFLYFKGSIEILKQPSVGCVGTREMTPYGKRVTEMFVPEFVRAGLVTVSGLAEGIDAEVAKETLHAGGKTVAALGHGLGMIFPKSNDRLAEEIVESGGVLLSEFALDIRADKYTFPARNRIIAGLSLATVVFEAPEGSGALITADLALEYGREVFAVPGQIFDPNYAGSHSIIAKGTAKLAVSPEVVLADLGIVASQRQSTEAYTASDPEEAKVYAELTSMPQSTSDIVDKAGLSAAIVNAKLTLLELQGVAKNSGRGLWVRA